MTQDISNERALLNSFLDNAKQDGVGVTGRWKFWIDRWDGESQSFVTEYKELNNIVTKDGLNAIAELMLGDATGTNSGFKYIVVGTQTAAGSLGSVQGGIGEVSRKIAATIASSNEVAILVMTWAGNADSLTGIALASAGIANHASSGSGIMGNVVNSVDATLQASDFLKIQVEIQIGSHNL